ncbi:phosphoribosyltransferase family protein [Nocardia sp. NPDC051832]|uniref:phosphoribosyltransferase family protein n=1 Tax=Nocardia sp. NPDC051832 TaxID=3155673 RepID=UPI003433ED06
MELASFIIGIVGLVFGVAAMFKWTIDLRRRARYRDVIKAISKLDGVIRHHRFDVVVGLADGLVPAAIIALNFRIPEVHFVDATVSLRRGNQQMAPIDVSHIPDLSGKSVLLIDNHLYTGTNMRTAVAALAANNASAIVTMALFKHQMSTAVFEPDHYVYKVNGRVRSVPWGITPEHRSEYLS